MAKIPSFFLLLVLSGLCTADIYRWVDNNGNVTYSDQPPPSSTKQEKKIKSGRSSTTSSTPVGKSLEEQDLDFRQRRAKAEEERAKQEQDASSTKERSENCQRAKSRLTNLQAGGRAIKYNAQGEQVFLNDQEIKQEIVETQKSVDSWCNPPKSN